MARKTIAVSFDMPDDDVSFADIREFVVDALGSMGGCRHPEDPLFHSLSNVRVRSSAGGELEAIKVRLADNKRLERFVYEIFYANPIGFARENLVIALQRHLLGEPISTPEEERERMLEQLSAEDRAAWWRAENARRLA
jgi:hypothetical protein